MCLIKECICWWKESWCYQNARYNNKKSILILSSHLRQAFLSGLFPSGLLTKTLYAPLLSPIRTKRSAQLIRLLTYPQEITHFYSKRPDQEFYNRMTVHRNRFLVNKTNRCTEFQFYWYYDSTCFGQPFCPSSGVLSCTSALVHFMQLWHFTSRSVPKPMYS